MIFKGSVSRRGTKGNGRRVDSQSFLESAGADVEFIFLFFCINPLFTQTLRNVKIYAGMGSMVIGADGNLEEKEKKKNKQPILIKCKHL